MTTEQERLVIDNLALATFMAQRHNYNYDDLDDLISIARTGLVKAAAKFDENRESKFGTFAGMVMTNEILMHYRKTRRHLVCLSLETPICTDGEGHDCTIADTLTDDRRVEDGIMRACEQEQVRELMGTVLNEREQKVIRLRYGFDGREHTQYEVAGLLGYTQSYVSRIERGALKKLRTDWKE